MGDSIPVDSSNDDFYSNPNDATKLMIDKATVIGALKKLIDEYPAEFIPRSVVRQSLIKVMGSSSLGDLSDHPALQKLDQILIKARSVNSS
jgi:hypothetical protein